MQWLLANWVAHWTVVNCVTCFDWVLWYFSLPTIQQLKLTLVCHMLKGNQFGNSLFSSYFLLRYPYYPWSSVLKQFYFMYRLTHVLLRELRQMSIFAHVLCKNECRTQSSQDPLDHKCMYINTCHTFGWIYIRYRWVSSTHFGVPFRLPVQF